MRGYVTDAGRTNNEQLKIELLSQWKLEAESRNSAFYCIKTGDFEFLQISVKQDHQRWGYSTVERFAKKLNKDKRKGQRKPIF